jgi:integrase
LHSYRYAWAERARKAGYPERFAQEALGHNSKAVHRAYAKRAQVTLPSLEQYERNSAAENIIPLAQQTGSAIPEAGQPSRALSTKAAGNA